MSSSSLWQLGYCLLDDRALSFFAKLGGQGRALDLDSRYTCPSVYIDGFGGLCWIDNALLRK